MKKFTAISIFYYFSAAYDGILGLAFIFLPLSIYSKLDIVPPNHIGYLHFPAALLIVFALMFISIGRHPLKNRNLIPYGIMLKISYCSVVFWHWFAGGIPDMWKLFAIFDSCFAIIFVWTYIVLGREQKEG